MTKLTTTLLFPKIAFTSDSSADISKPDSSFSVQHRTIAPYAGLAPLYDALLGHRFFLRLRRVFEWLVRRYGLRFASAADVACGTGLFVRYLRQQGVPVIYGVDRSPAMLRVAVARSRGSGARFLRQDFATLQLPQPVDLITCNFDSLNYLLTTTDLLRALRRFQANLKPGGQAIFDMITDRPPWPDPQPRVERVARPGLTFVRVTRRERRRGISGWCAISEWRCIQTAHISIAQAGRIEREIHVQRGYPVALVAGLLAQAGFTLCGAHDFQTLGLATAWSSRVVYVAQRSRLGFVPQPNLRS